MNIDFPLILVCAVFVSGFIWLIDSLFFAKGRPPEGKLPLLVDYARTFFPVLLAVLLIRSFLFRPFRVPTGSLAPTVQPVEVIGVNQYAYGLRLPVIHTKVYQIGEPKRGEIAVFRWPVNEHVDFVKRVIGLPGDHITYKNKRLTINGRPITLKFLERSVDESTEEKSVVEVYEENLNGINHKVYLRPDVKPRSNVDVVVPEGAYFMMGDNRDDSLDSRVWGFVPEENLIGKAFSILASWDKDRYKIRWNRFFQTLQ